ncbi:MAG: META domain-containing protein [Phocaeicola sp.]
MKKLFSKVALVSVSALALSACCGNAKVKGTSLAEIAGEWTIEVVQGTPVPTTLEKTPFLAIDAVENRVYGTAGCNNINGLIEVDSVNVNQFSFKNVATTMMMCPDMETEALVLKTLGEVKKADMPEADKLLLLDEAGNELMALKKK